MFSISARTCYIVAAYSIHEMRDRMKFLRASWYVLKTAAVDWHRDDAPRLGAAISYYSIFSVAPLLVIAIAISGWFFGDKAARGEVFEQVNRLLGNESAARAIEELVVSASRPKSGEWATTLSFVALWIGASGVFTQIKGSLDAIWEVERKPGAGLRAVLFEYAWSVVMVAAVGLLLLASLVATSALSAAAAFAHPPIVTSDYLNRFAYRVVSLLVLVILFAALFKLLPDVKVRWRDVWVGAGVTALLFTLGKYLIGWYLGRLVLASAYGAAGSFVLLLVWTYYSAQIFLFGAEVTQVYARMMNGNVFPTARAQFVAAAVKPDRRTEPRR